MPGLVCILRGLIFQLVADNIVELISKPHARFPLILYTTYILLSYAFSSFSYWFCMGEGLAIGKSSRNCKSQLQHVSEERGWGEGHSRKRSVSLYIYALKC